MTIHKTTMPLTLEQIQEIQSTLNGWGDKQRFAKYAGIHPTTLSRNLAYKKHADGFAWPATLWAKFKEYKNTL